MHARDLITQYEQADESRGYHESLRDLAEALTEYFSWVKGKILIIDPSLKNTIDELIYIDYFVCDKMGKIALDALSFDKFVFRDSHAYDSGRINLEYSINIQKYFPGTSWRDIRFKKIVFWFFRDRIQVDFDFTGIQVKEIFPRQTFNKAEFVKFLMESETSKHLIRLSRTKVN